MFAPRCAEITPPIAMEKAVINSNPAIMIGQRHIGLDEPCYVIAEIGINHNGDVGIAKQLIDRAVLYGFDAVKFQKRTVDVVFTLEELARPRESPFGTTNGDLKRALEFEFGEYKEIDRYCREKRMHWFASAWDEKSIDFLERFDPLCHKIASASLTDDNLLRRVKAAGRPVILSTGMSTLEEIDRAVEILGGVPLMPIHRRTMN